MAVKGGKTTKQTGKTSNDQTQFYLITNKKNSMKTNYFQ